MNSTNWKDLAELIGIAAIVASLIFVGLQMKQAQAIAVAEAEGTRQTLDNSVLDAINQYAEVWSKGVSSGDLTESENIIFDNLVTIGSTQAFFTFSQRKILDHPRANLAAHRFAFFLYQNPGARSVWINYVEGLARADAILLEDNPLISEWRDIIRRDLLILDQAHN